MTKKAKPRKAASKKNDTKIDEQQKKIERLELLSKAQDLEHMSTKVQALQVQLQKLQSDANMVNRQIVDIKAEGEEMAQKYVAELNAYKKKYNVPKDKEVNLRTGELVDPQPQQQPPGAVPVPQEGQAPVEPPSEEATQS